MRLARVESPAATCSGPDRHLQPDAVSVHCGGTEQTVSASIDQRERFLELALAPLERLEFGALPRQRLDELADLRMLREGDATQVLDVLLSLQLVLAHASYRSHRAIGDKRSEERRHGKE